MEKFLKLTYYYNSGFSVQVGGTLLIFDYWEGEDRSLPPASRINETFLQAFEQIFVFVSHAHPDHFDPVIYSWYKHGLPVSYIVSYDMPVGTRGSRLAPLQEKQLTQDIKVKAFGSTDLGVSYLVSVYGMTIFHAGDLNLWHWRSESTLKEIEEAEQKYYDAVAPLRQEHIDVAMFPVDPRQGSMYDAGANHFIMTEKPRIFIPMHWQDRPEVATEYARRTRNPQTEVVALTKAGTIANLTFTDEVLDIHIIEPPKELDDQLYPLRKPAGVKDPFADTDLPVNLV